MPRSSTRRSSSRLNTNQNVETAGTATSRDRRKTATSSNDNLPIASDEVRTSPADRSLDGPSGNTSSTPPQHEDVSMERIPHISDHPEELQRMTDERNHLLVQTAEVQNLRNQIRASSAQAPQPSSSSGRTQLIPRPEGRTIKLQEDMKLGNNKAMFLSIRRTIKDVVKRAGLDCMVRWEHQPKEKLAKIFWIAQDRQPYLRHFAHNWPIKEYIKRHHKNTRAYLRRLANDGTNATLPNVESDEMSDSQGEVLSDVDMELDDM